MNVRTMIAFSLSSVTAMGVGIECFSPPDQLAGNRVTVNEFAYYEQRSLSNLVLNTGIQGPSLYASINGIKSLGLVGATLTIPSNPERTVEFRNFLGLSYSEYPKSREDLEEADPVVGDYTLAITTAEGSSSAKLRFPSLGWPPAPRFTHFDDLQVAEAAGDIVVRWNPLPGADVSDSYLKFQLVNESGNAFFASSTCTDGGGIVGSLTRKLPVSADSVTIPRGFLSPGNIYKMQLSFERHRLTTMNLAGINQQGTVLSIETVAILKTRGGVPIVAAKITSFSFGDGGLNLEYEGTAGHEFVIEGAIELLGPWNEIGRDTSGEGKGTIGFIPNLLGPVGFVRVVTR